MLNEMRGNNIVKFYILILCVLFSSSALAKQEHCSTVESEKLNKMLAYTVDGDLSDEKKISIIEDIILMNGSSLLRADGDKNKLSEGMCYLHYLESKGDDAARNKLIEAYYKQGKQQIAKQLTKKGVLENNSLSMYYLYLLMSENETFEHKARSAWLEKAALNGVSAAQCQIGVSLLNENFSEAIKWFETAAKKGIIQCQYNLAIAYLENDTAIYSVCKSHYWANIAANKNDKDAKELLLEKSELYAECK